MATKKFRQLIEGRVARVLDQREVVLNVGAAAGVEVGMRFVILSAETVDIPDPVTGEPLGSVEVPKHVVKVVRVPNENMSVARTFRTIKGRQSLASVWAGATEDRVETIDVPVDETTVRSQVEEGFRVVRVGDRVIETEGDEYDV